MTEEDGRTGTTHAIDPEALHGRIRRGERVSILDVRNRDEFESWRVDGPSVTAAQVPTTRFVEAQVAGSVAERFAETGLDEPVVAVCARGEASASVADLLREEGIEAVNLAGGMDAWARLYEARELSAAPTDATVLQYERPASGCLAYLVVSDDEAAVVDPLRAFADRYERDARERGSELAYAVDTHVHADHVSGVRKLAAETDATPVVPAGATDRGLALDAETRTLADGDDLRVGDVALEAVHAPGHTSELVVLRLDGIAFTADALFLDGVGRPDLEAGAAGAPDLAARLYGALHDRLLSLPGETVVAPGHVGPDAAPAADGTLTARLGDVRERLDLLDLAKEAFVERVTSDPPQRPANYETILDVNLGRRDVDAETAFELELGPNNCAVSGVD